MDGPLEREIKLRMESVEDARARVIAAGGTVVRSRRLQSDAVLDDAASTLRSTRSALRVRVEPGRSYLTFKGPPHVSTMKLREELETEVADAATLFALLDRLGYRVSFRYEKYREEYTLDDVLVAIDETPVGTFMEVEGSAEGIERVVSRLGRTPGDFVVESYRTIYVQTCLARGLEPGDMLFGR